MKILLYSLALFFAVQLNICAETKITVNGKAVKFTYLHNKNEIQDATKIRSTFKKLMKSVSSCMNSENTNNKCNCTYKEQHAELNRLVTSALKKYPHWLKTKAIKFGANETLYMQGLKKQAAQKLKC